ncbi:MAG: DUF4836 family protein [Bacteroidota bacterium]
MHRSRRSILLLLSLVMLVSACSRIPDHMRYIPKEAVMVTGINAKALGKKIAWNVITGSKLFREMQARMPQKSAKDAISGIEKAGVDAANTFYVYVKTDNRFKGGNRITGLVPLADAGAWEAYVKRVFPNAQIKQQGERKEASLSEDLYVGWNKSLLIAINTIATPGNVTGDEAPVAGAADMTAEMENAFAVSKDNSLSGNQRFMALEQEGHDVTFWLNYDQLMTQYSGDMAQKAGVSLSGTLWKDAVFTSGFDFKKGKITGDMHYYVADEMKDIGKELGSANADKDMIGRLPNDSLDVLFAIHLSPKGLKGLLEKTGLLGLANIGLSESGLTVDNVLNSVTGDMAFAMNSFRLRTEQVTDSFMGQVVTHKIQKPTLAVSYAIKINDRAQFQKIVDLAKANGLRQSGNGFVMPLNTEDSVYILLNDQYVVASNKYMNATRFLEGSFKSGKMPAEAAGATAHPLGLYIDIEQLFNNTDAGISSSPRDSAMIAESRKLLRSFSLSGGEFKNSSFEYHLDINFKNTEENSILQLMDYGMKISEADKVAAR